MLLPVAFLPAKVELTESNVNFASMMMTNVAFETLLIKRKWRAKAQGLVAWDYYTGYRIGKVLKSYLLGSLLLIKKTNSEGSLLQMHYPY